MGIKREHHAIHFIALLLSTHVHAGMGKYSEHKDYFGERGSRRADMDNGVATRRTLESHDPVGHGHGLLRRESADQGSFNELAIVPSSTAAAAPAKNQSMHNDTSAHQEPLHSMHHVEEAHEAHDAHEGQEAYKELESRVEKLEAKANQTGTSEKPAACTKDTRGCQPTECTKDNWATQAEHGSTYLKDCAIKNWSLIEANWDKSQNKIQTQGHRRRRGTEYKTGLEAVNESNPPYCTNTHASAITRMWTGVWCPASSLDKTKPKYNADAQHKYKEQTCDTTKGAKRRSRATRDLLKPCYCADNPDLTWGKVDNNGQPRRFFHLPVCEVPADDIKEDRKFQIVAARRHYYIKRRPDLTKSDCKCTYVDADAVCQATVSGSKATHGSFDRRIGDCKCEPKCVEWTDPNDHNSECKMTNLMTMGVPGGEKLEFLSFYPSSLGRYEETLGTPNIQCVDSGVRNSLMCRFLYRAVGTIARFKLKMKFGLRGAQINGMTTGIFKVFWTGAAEVGGAVLKVTSVIGIGGVIMGFLSVTANFLKFMNAAFCTKDKCTGILSAMLMALGIMGIVMFFCPVIAAAVGPALALVLVVVAFLVREKGLDMCKFISLPRKEKLQLIGKVMKHWKSKFSSTPDTFVSASGDVSLTLGGAADATNMENSKAKLNEFGTRSAGEMSPEEDGTKTALVTDITPDMMAGIPDTVDAISEENVTKSNEIETKMKDMALDASQYPLKNGPALHLADLQKDLTPPARDEHDNIIEPVIGIGGESADNEIDDTGEDGTESLSLVDLSGWAMPLTLEEERAIEAKVRIQMSSAS